MCVFFFFCTLKYNSHNLYDFQIWWLPREYRHNVRDISSGFKQVYNVVDEMNADGGNFLNMKYSSLSTHKIR